MQSVFRAAARPAFSSARVARFSTSPIARKSAVDSAKDAVKTADRTVSDAAVKGIEKGEQAADSLKASAGVGAKDAEGKAKEVAGEAKGKAHEVAGQAKGKAEEIKGKM